MYLECLFIFPVVIRLAIFLFLLTTTIINSINSNKLLKNSVFSPSLRTVLNMLVSLQTHLTCSPEPVLELVNKYIQEKNLKLVILQDIP